MALASLCSRATTFGKNRPSCSAFIVDHRLRQGSEIEARKVANILKQMRIDAEILTLSWGDVPGWPNIRQNLESVARRLRYQALGKACRDRDINSLLLAHHADDQAETVLTRMISGYTGSGFRGIKAESRIPECHGVYGVSESGLPQPFPCTTLGISGSPLAMESGGIKVYRPLLDFQKSELIATCEQEAVTWFEDPTNADKGLTLRNTIRHLWGNGRLPNALSPSTMIEMAERVDERDQKREQAAEYLFNQCTIELDIRSGILNLVFSPDIKEQLLSSDGKSDAAGEASHKAAMLLRKVLSLVTPKSGIVLRDLVAVAKTVFPFLSPRNEEQTSRPAIESSHTAAAGLYISPESAFKVVEKLGLKQTNQHMKRLVLPSEPSASHQASQTSLDTPDASSPRSAWRIERQRVPTVQLGNYVLTLASAENQRNSSVDNIWTDWQLFDGRFWLRLRHRPFNISPNHAVVMRFLHKKDLEQLRQSLSSREVEYLDSRLKHCAPGNSRFTLPVIVERYTTTGSKGKLEFTEEVRALPTIGWGRQAWRAWKSKDEATVPWRWECRYKMIEFGKGDGHSIRIPPPPAFTRGIGRPGSSGKGQVNYLQNLRQVQ